MAIVRPFTVASPVAVPDAHARITPSPDAEDAPEELATVDTREILVPVIRDVPDAFADVLLIDPPLPETVADPIAFATAL
jgi:hypothetical protein